MGNLHLIDAIFLARREIRSLPEWHAARWSSFLRFACAEFGVPLNSFILGLLPLRNGKKFIRQGETLILRLILKTSGLDFLTPLGHAMTCMEAIGEFSPTSLELLFWRDAVGLRNYPVDLPDFKPETLNQEAVSSEIAHLKSLENFRLHFFVPLRLKTLKPENTDERRRTTFCTPEIFNKSGAIAHLCEKVRLSDCLLPRVKSVPTCRTIHNKLCWRDMRYNQMRQIALGGLAGELCLSGRLAEDLVMRLVLGQYLGAGKNPLFGLGYWKIPELDPVRKIPLELMHAYFPD